MRLNINTGFKGDRIIDSSASEMKVLIKPYNLPQTRIKSDINKKVIVIESSKF